MFIQKIKILNYRSIINLDIKVDQSNNFISFCWANNVWKTNILNALNLFFWNDEYYPEKDCPNHKYYWTRWWSYQPKIEIIFSNWKNIFQIIKDWNLTQSQRENSEIFYNINWKSDKKSLSEKDCEQIVNKINFFFLPSINLSFPEAIKYIMNSDILDLEMEKSRMSWKKKDMKENIEKVLNDLKAILNILWESISPLLEKYKTWWGVAFDIPTEITTFRDLMIWEIDFYIKDKSNSKAIDAKWSWLQRLCHILMYFRIISKLNDKKQTAIICIDEPDVYIHSWLQKKLLDDIRTFSEKNQFFITTHSPIFIDTIKLSNVFLLDQKVQEKEYTRWKRKSWTIKYNAVETHLIELSTESWVSTLKNYLWIEDKDQLLFDKYNILVEWESDKIYLSKLMEHFWISVPNIIFTSWADNIIKYLEFYENICDPISKCCFLVLLDNDDKWREVSKKIKPKSFTNIDVKIDFIISNSWFTPILDKNWNTSANIEVEDFILSEILCYLLNKILKRKNLSIFKAKDINQISRQIKQKAFQNNGILVLLENEKNRINPTDWDKINILNEWVKSWMASIFNQLDSEIISLIWLSTDDKNKHIFNFLKDISKIK
jgi:predicted ATP-dependent endonuclease of OLD family